MCILLTYAPYLGVVTIWYSSYVATLGNYGYIKLRRSSQKFYVNCVQLWSNVTVNRVIDLLIELIYWECDKNRCIACEMGGFLKCINRIAKNAIFNRTKFSGIKISRANLIIFLPFIFGKVRLLGRNNSFIGKILIC